MPALLNLSPCTYKTTSLQFAHPKISRFQEKCTEFNTVTFFLLINQSTKMKPVELMAVSRLIREERDQCLTKQYHS